MILYIHLGFLSYQKIKWFLGPQESSPTPEESSPTQHHNWDRNRKVKNKNIIRITIITKIGKQIFKNYKMEYHNRDDIILIEGRVSFLLVSQLTK